MISELLFNGRENAITGRELARFLQCSMRDISKSIERERRAGVPIIASCDPENPGYYLAETAEELQAYCRKLDARAYKIYATSSILLLKAEDLPPQEKNTNAQSENKDYRSEQHKPA